MKRIIVLLGLLLAVFLLLVSCSDKTDTPEIDDFQAEAVGADAVSAYYSLKTNGGFADYLSAFPEEWLIGYQKEQLGYDDDTFAIAVENAGETVKTMLEEEFSGATVYVEYTFSAEREIPENEYNDIMKELVDYLYISQNTVEDIKAQIYSVRTYAVDDNGNVVSDQTEDEELYMLYITQEGWKVSPHEYTLP